MIKQCGNCEFWDRDRQDQLYERDKRMYAFCNYELPSVLPESVESIKMREDEGQDCPVYNELHVSRKDDDPPDEDGYTRADEDWFFDDKDD